MRYVLSDLTVPVMIICASFYCGLELYFDHKKEMAGYHCAPIVKVSTMEEAKKQVEMYQAAVRG